MRFEGLQINQAAEQCPEAREIFTLSRRSHEKRGGGAEWEESVIATFTNWPEAERGAKIGLSQCDKRRRVLFVQKHKRTDAGAIAYAREYPIRRDRYIMGDGTIEGESIEIKSFCQKAEKEERRKLAKKIAREQGITYSEALAIIKEGGPKGGE